MQQYPLLPYHRRSVFTWGNILRNLSLIDVEKKPIGGLGLNVL